MKQKIVNFCLTTNIWIYLIPLLSIFSVMTFFIIPNLQQQIGGGELLDTKFSGYGLNDVNSLMEQLGKSGRSTYLYLELFGDLPFIIFYVITFTIFIVRLLEKNKTKSQILFLTTFLPLLVGIFDCLEDVAVIKILLTYPIIGSKTIYFCSSITTLKGYFLTFTMFSLLLNLIIFVLKKIKG